MKTCKSFCEHIESNSPKVRRSKKMFRAEVVNKNETHCLQPILSFRKSHGCRDNITEGTSPNSTRCVHS
jgi:hypothetical protein